MLVANFSNGKSISLLDSWEYETLQDLRRKESFVCPICQSNVILRLGKVKQWHFAHEKETALCSSYERESDFHLNGKKQLYQWLSHNGYTTQIEVYIKKIKQRPDVLYQNNGHTIALEFQCSPIGVDLHKKRTSAYQQINIFPLWIIGANRLQRLSRDLFSLSPLEWSSIFLPKPKPFPSLIYFCPNEKQFILLNNIITLSATKARASIYTIKLNEISSFQELLLQSNKNNHLIDQWLSIKKKWRYHCTPYPSKAQLFFNQYSLKLIQSPFLFPIEAGWPHENIHWIETPAYIWQSWILYEWVWKKPLNTSIYFQEVYKHFKEMLKARYFTVRSLPLIEGHYSFAIMSYLNELVAYGVLEKQGGGNFSKKREIEIVNTIDQAIILDKKLAEKNKYLSQKKGMS